MNRKAIQAESAAAFEVIVAHYEARLIRYAARITGSADAAQDVVQDAFIRLFRRWKDALEPSPQLSSWLFRVTHNRAVDAVRKRSRWSDVEKRHADEQPETVPPDRGADFRISDQAARAEEALRTLSAREQQLVILKVYEEKSYKEIGEITGLTTGNVGYILHHAMRKMAAAYKEGGAV